MPLDQTFRYFQKRIEFIYNKDLHCDSKEVKQLCGGISNLENNQKNFDKLKDKLSCLVRVGGNIPTNVAV